MYTQKTAKKHLYIIITIVIAFSTFMVGYSYSSFMEVGFGDESQGIEPDAAAIEKQYEDLYKTEDE